MTGQTTIIPIAGGKGGVGKSFLAANLAVALAQRGHRTLAVDLDLGNSNLHSLLGLQNSYPGIGEYLRGSIKCSPEDLIVETGITNLGFIPGDARVPFMANINYPQKLKLIRFLKSLSARYILLDLSAGTSFNTLDLFQLGRYGIVVTTPEYPALMSALVFVKNLTLRAVDEALRSDKSLKEKLTEMHKQSVNDPVFTMRKFRSDIHSSHPEAAEKIDEICARIRPRFIYNMIESANDAEQFANVDTTCSDVLSIECDHIGLVPYDLEVRHFLKEPGVFMLQRSSSVTAKIIDRISRRIVNLWDSPMEGSAALLTAYAREVFSDDSSSEVASAAG